MSGHPARRRQSGEPYALPSLVLTSIIVLVYTVAAMPLLPASVQQSFGALGQRASGATLRAASLRATSNFAAEQPGVKPQDQFQFSWERILANIGTAAGAAPGAVIASPSKSEPDYFVSQPP